MAQGTPRAKTAAAPASRAAERELEAWRRSVLPFAMVGISVMAIIFFGVSVVQLLRLDTTLSYRPSHQVEAALASYEKTAQPDADYLRWKTLVLLEEDAIDHRYEQVNATLILRAWTRHLGFLTGMILSLVGAIFILARLSEAETKLSGNVRVLRFALATTSPGIVLATLGAVLMVITLSVDFQFTTSDAPVYVLNAGAPPALPPARPLASPDAVKQEEAKLFGSPGGAKR
jgi:hypothetical protein